MCCLVKALGGAGVEKLMFGCMVQWRVPTAGLSLRARGSPVAVCMIPNGNKFAQHCPSL